MRFTWCHSSPADIPTGLCIVNIGTEDKVDHVASACDIGRQRGADRFKNTLSFNYNIAIRSGAAALPHQSCPVAVHDCQVVGLTINVKCIEVLFEISADSI